LVAVFRALSIDRLTSVAWLEVQWRATVIAELGTSRVGVVAEVALGEEHGQHLDGKITEDAIASRKVCLPSQ
jgi:hypothetical protein